MVTPIVIRYGLLPSGAAYELAEGEGIFDRRTTLYGVSVVNVLPDGSTARDFDKSKMFHTLQDAEEHIRSLKKNT